MNNEKLTLQAAEYIAIVEKASVKFPERKNLEYNRLYMPLDLRVWIMRKS